MHRILIFLLAFFARAIIRRHQPYIIGITGTVGKTTVSSFVVTYLVHTYGVSSVMFSPYHYNGEYGLPLSIIGAKTGGKNFFLWVFIFARAIFRLFRPYPRYLVLEYGIDHPGEMEHLISIARPDIAIINPVISNHLEQFGTYENYLRAKLLLAESAKGYTLLHDTLREYRSSSDTLYFGRMENSDARITHLEQDISGLDIRVSISQASYDIRLPVFGLYQAENILPLYLLASLLALPASSIATIAHRYIPEPGRSNHLSGIGGSHIIDGSYNGGFESLCRSIDTLVPFCGKYRIVCFFGDMREIGSAEEALHRELARYMRDTLSGYDDIYLYLVGPLMERYVAPGLDGMSVVTGKSSRVLAHSIRELILQSDMPTIISVKGSQNTIFLEEGIKELLEKPDDVGLLCRQSDAWMKKKEVFFSSLSQDK